MKRARQINFDTLLVPMYREGDVYCEFHLTTKRNNYKQMKLLRSLSIIVILFFQTTNIQSQKTANINWPEYMSRHDLVYEQIPLQWNEGAFVGNGHIGMMMYATMKDNRIDFHLGRTDITDHRNAPNKKSSLGTPGASLMRDYPRLDIGRMAFRPVGKILSGSFRQDLWNAEIRGIIVTDLGTITLKAYTPYNRFVNIIELTSTEKKDGKSVKYAWDFRPGNPASPRLQIVPSTDLNYITNPKPVLGVDKNIHSCVQTLLAGGDYATAWLEKNTGKSQSTLYISTANEVPEVNKSLGLAKEAVLDASTTSSAKILTPHRNWWHAYYQKSFLSIPNGQMESFYWIQMHKMATCSRPDGPALDLLGPFYKNTVWPGMWWNLNIQLTYWNVLQSNHLELGENMIKIVDDQFDALLRQFNNQKLGDFTWTMHNYWLQLRYGGDWKVLNEKWLPKAMQVAKNYEKFLIKKENGQLEMAPMESPEYDGFKSYKNSNYNMALYRWILGAMIECADKNNAKMPEITAWKQTLKVLVPFATNENGLMIGSEQAVDKSHRHYSHLMSLYPLFVLNPDDSIDRELVDKSVVHWHKIDNGKELCGYSYTGASSLYATLGRGNDTEAIMHRFLNGSIGISQLNSNTFYTEVGGKWPTIETPLSGANAISEMLLQSWGGIIRIFPAMPDTWKEGSFDQLRTQGAFLVSAKRTDGQTQWVKVKSLVGEPCIVKIKGWTTAIQANKGRKYAITPLSKNEFSIDIKAGEEVMLVPAAYSKIEPIVPVKLPMENYNLYGVKKGKEIKTDQSAQLPDYIL